MSFKCEKIEFSYDIVPILTNISTEFEKGYFYGILGPNGCGKTTLLNILSGISDNQEGKVLFGNEEINIWTIKQRAKKIAYVHQKKDTLEFDFSVRDIIIMGRYAYLSRFNPISLDDNKVVDDIINEMGIDNIKDKSYLKLSGGEQQKVTIARAIAQEADILLLDEPTSHLDINYQIELMEFFRKLVSKGIIVIAVLHDLNLATQFCDKLVLMKKGRIISSGLVEEVITEENILNSYNIKVHISRNPITNSILISPLQKNRLYCLNNEKNLHGHLFHIHILVGGGSAIRILNSVQDYDISIGVVNVLDDDYSLAEKLNYEIISEAPFSPISESAIEKLKQVLRKTDLIIVSNMPFGNANIKNLEIINQFEGKIILFNETSIKDRDFTNGHAEKLYNSISRKTKVEIITDFNILLQKIEIHSHNGEIIE